MNRLASTVLLFAFTTPAAALSIESVDLMVDDAGEPGDAVDAFAPSDRIQHFKIHLDETKLGQHEWLVEFWADETESGNNIRITDFKASGLIANTIDAKVELPRDWPIGSYVLVVKMDGEEVGTYEYAVDEASGD